MEVRRSIQSTLNTSISAAVNQFFLPVSKEFPFMSLVHKNVSLSGLETQLPSSLNGEFKAPRQPQTPKEGPMSLAQRIAWWA